MRKLNVLVVTGTRAEYGTYKPLMSAMRKSAALRPRFLVTGMHTLKKFGHTVDEIRNDGMPIGDIVPVRATDDMPRAFSKEISGIADYCASHPVDCVIVLGDRDEQLAAAIVAIHYKIPVAHIAGGDVSGEGPDEFVRGAITKLSHLHFVSTKRAKARVLAMGEEHWRVTVTGAIGLDGLKSFTPMNRAAIQRKYSLDTTKKWFLVLHHPTPLDVTPFTRQIAPLLKVLAASRAEIVLISPNSDTGSDVFLKEIEKFRAKHPVRFFKNFPREEYLSMMQCFDLLIGNSSSGIIESTCFNIPVVDIGSRQRGRESAGNIIHTGYGERDISRALAAATSDRFRDTCRRAKSPYGSGGVSEKIVGLLEKHAEDIRTKKGNFFFKKPPVSMQ